MTVGDRVLNTFGGSRQNLVSGYIILVVYPFEMTLENLTFYNPVCLHPVYVFNAHVVISSTPQPFQHLTHSARCYT